MGTAASSSSYPPPPGSCVTVFFFEFDACSKIDAAALRVAAPAARRAAAALQLWPAAVAHDDFQVFNQPVAAQHVRVPFQFVLFQQGVFCRRQTITITKQERN